MFKIIISLTVTKVLFKIWNRPAADDSPLALPNVSGCVLVCELNMYTDIRHWNRISTRTAILSRLVHSSHIHTINHHHRSLSTRPNTETQSCDISPLAMILFSSFVGGDIPSSSSSSNDNLAVVVELDRFVRAGQFQQRLLYPERRQPDVRVGVPALAHQLRHAGQEL